MPAPEHYLVVDLEATCDDQGAVPRLEMETIEIGAVLVRASDLVTVDEFTTFVQPIRHPLLTPFCTQLTTIVQAQVDGAPLFPEAMRGFVRAMWAGRGALFCSWGAYDRTQLMQDCALHKMDYPLGSGHLNLKEAFSEQQGLRKKEGMAGALRLAKLELVGTHHRGIDDARNIARLLPWCLGRLRLPR